MISFRSRVDVDVPTGVTALASKAQTSFAGATVIAGIGAAPQSRLFLADGNKIYPLWKSWRVNAR
jgi:hypothetical protein